MVVRMSRIERRKQVIRAKSKRRMTGMIWAVLAGMMIGAWYFNILVFTILSVVIFFGIICINYHNVRNYVPGLVSTRRYIRVIAICFYLIAILALIGKASISGLK